MPKHHIFLHIGPDVIDLSDEDRQRLAAAGVRTTKKNQDDLLRADLEIRRRHRIAGLKRKDVEGAWAEICRTIYAARSDAFLSLPGFFTADSDQADLALDGLHGLKVHLIVTLDGHTGLPYAWSNRVKPERSHVLAPGSSPADLAAEVIRVAISERKERLAKSLLPLKRRRKQARDEIAA